MDNNNIYENDSDGQNGSCAESGAGPDPYANQSQEYDNGQPDVNASQSQEYGYGQPDVNAGQNQGYGYGQPDVNAGQNQGYGYGQPNGGQGYPYPQQGGYQQELEVPVSMGEWLVSLLLIMFVPCVNIVLMFVWAFSKKEKKSKSNFFKAQLILSGILLAIYIIILLVFGVTFMVAMMSS